MLGKLLWYYGGRELDRFGFVSRRMERPRPRRRSTGGGRAPRAGRGTARACSSSRRSSGIPPYAVLAVLAGALRVPLAVFLVTGLVGRAVRFSAVIGGDDDGPVVVVRRSVRVAATSAPVADPGARC